MTWHRMGRRAWQEAEQVEGKAKGQNRVECRPRDRSGRETVQEGKAGQRTRARTGRKAEAEGMAERNAT